MVKLYVGNIPFRADDESLKELFATHGTVHSAVVIMDRASGRSKGFGFVEVDDDAEESFIEKFHQYDMDGRTLVVNKARPPKHQSN